MNREFLKNLGLDDDTIDAVIREHGKTVNDTKKSVNDLTTERDNLKAERDNLQGQLNDRDEQLSNLEDKAEGNEDLKQEIADLKQSNLEAKNNFEKELNEKTFEFELDKSLLQSNAKNPAIVKANLNRETLQLGEDNKIIGLNEQLESMKESDGYLFKSDDEGENQGGSETNHHTAGSNKRTNQGRDVNPYELGKQKAMERFNLNQEQ